MSSSSSDGDLVVIVYFILLFLFTCGTCNNTSKTEKRVGDLNEHMTALENKLDTLIKYQKQNSIK
jgi:hypothetical protein